MKKYFGVILKIIKQIHRLFIYQVTLLYDNSINQAFFYLHFCNLNIIGKILNYNYSKTFLLTF